MTAKRASYACEVVLACAVKDVNDGDTNELWSRIIAVRLSSLRLSGSH